MKTYKLFTKEPEKTIENIILHKALPLALKELANNLEKNNSVITKQTIIDNIPFFIFRGMDLLRKKDEEGKKIYELLHGCILASFLNKIEPNFQHYVCYPENESYDFLIIKHPKGRIADFTLPNKEIYKEATELRIELAELTNLDDLERIIISKTKYKERILLISIAFVGKLNFQEVSDKASNVNKNNFETIWLMGKIDYPEDKNKLCYFIAELVKHKEAYLFDLPIDWDRIEREFKLSFA